MQRSIFHRPSRQEKETFAIAGRRQASRTSKNARIGLTAALGAMLALFPVIAEAQYSSISWNQKQQATGSNGYLPRVASDASSENSISSANILIYQIHSGFDALNYITGGTQDLYHSGLFWSGPISGIGSPTQLGPEVGLAPGIAMAQTFTGTDVVIEVHQGGQDNGSELWYRAGQCPVGVTSYHPELMAWGPASAYDHGYNPTVAVDQTTSSTIVEVHQAAEGSSELWYHVGQIAAGRDTPSVVMQPAEKTGLQGSAPSVTVFDNVVVLAVQSSGPDSVLSYSIGVVQVDANTGVPTGIKWGPLTQYDHGYNPSVSLEVNDLSYHQQYNSWVLVEAHQAHSGTGELLYKIGTMPLNGTNPTTINWQYNPTSKSYSTEFDSSGCYPSVAQVLYGTWGVVETNSTACEGSATANIVSYFGGIQ
jgi:hypothetical protein